MWWWLIVEPKENTSLDFEGKGHQGGKCFGSSNEVSGLVVTKGLNVDMISTKGEPTLIDEKRCNGPSCVASLSTRLLSQGMMQCLPTRLSNIETFGDGHTTDWRQRAVLQRNG